MRSLVLFLAALVLSSGFVFAQDRWQLTDTDFATRNIELVSMDADSVVFREGSREDKLSIDRVLRLRRAGVEIKPVGPFVLHLQFGNRLPGSPLRLDGESLRWRSASLGEVVVPLKEARGILVLNASEEALEREHVEDTLRLQNGDTVRGIIDSLTQQQVVVKTSDGREVQTPVESLQELIFASVGVSTPSRDRAFVVTTTDGSRVVCDSIRSDGTKARVTVFGAETSFPMSLVAQVEQVNGAVTWLSALEPVKAEHTPYFGVAMPARMNRGVTGGPVRIGKNTYDRVIGVHSRSVLVFALEGGFKKFRTAFAIDGDLPLANVDVRILADDKELFSRKGVRAGEAIVPKVLSVEGAKQLTLEVDYGENFDVQDRFVWIEPALLK